MQTGSKKGGVVTTGWGAADANAAAAETLQKDNKEDESREKNKGEETQQEQMEKDAIDDGDKPAEDGAGGDEWTVPALKKPDENADPTNGWGAQKDTAPAKGGWTSGSDAGKW
jgi:hypothetical protein